MTAAILGSFNNTTASNATSSAPQFTLPGGISTGDYGVVIVTLNGAASTLTATGWTITGPSDNATNMRTYVCTKSLASTDSGTTVTWSLSGAVRFAVAGAVVSGTTGTDVISAAAQDTALQSTMDVPGFTNTASYDLAVLLVSSQRNFATADGAATLPSGFNSRQDIATANTNSSDFGAIVADKSLGSTAPGAVAATTGTWNGSSRSNSYIVVFKSSSVAVAPTDASALIAQALTSGATVPADDTASGVDTAASSAAVSPADTGSDVEAVTTTASVFPTSNPSAARDSASVTASVGVGESATFIESASAAVELIHFDTTINCDVHWSGKQGGGGPRGFAASINIAGAFSGEDTSYVFSPPTYEDANPDDEFWVRYSMPKGQSIIRVNGALVLQTIPTMEQLVGVEGQDYFIGGHDYRIGTAVAAELTQYGFHVDGFDSFVGTWAGDSDQTSLYVTALTPDISLAGMLLSLSQDMSNPVVSAAKEPSQAGFTKHHFDGLEPGTQYWRQAFDGTTGNKIGDPHPAWTRRALGEGGITKIATFSCRQSAPASTATSDDILAWFRTDPTIHCRVMDTGDNGYAKTMDENIPSHEDHFAEQMKDESWFALGNETNRDYIGSDHDTNGTSTSNASNFNDPITQNNIYAWNNSLPFGVQDPRLRDKGRFGFREGHVAYGFPDTRCMDKTDPADKHNPRRPASPLSRMLGDDQMDRLLADIQSAKDDGCAVYVMFTDPAWNGTSEYPIDVAQSDKWPSFLFDRERISLAAATIGIPLFIVHGDDHGMKQDDGTMETNGHAVIGGSPFDKQLHANYQDAVQWFYPDGVNGSGGEDQAKQRHAMMYQRLTIDDNTGNPGHVVITAAARDCTPADTRGLPAPPSDCPKTVRTMVKTYVIP